MYMAGSGGGGYFTENVAPIDFSPSEESSADHWCRFVSHCQANDICPLDAKCSMIGSDHYHCKEPNCELSFR